MENPRVVDFGAVLMEEELHYPFQVTGDSSHGKLDGCLSQTPVTGLLQSVKPLQFSELSLYLRPFPLSSHYLRPHLMFP